MGGSMILRMPDQITLGLVSPASSIEAETVNAGEAFLKGLGFRLKRFPNILATHRHMAGPDEARAADLQAAFDDEEVDAVLCTRGGYGCARLLRLLDLDRMARSAKPFLGFSDITTLHLSLNRRGLPTLHAPMVTTFAKERAPWVADSFVRALAGDFALPKEAPRGQTIVGGTEEGIVTGGCLTLLTDSLGTPDAFCARGKIVLLEDVGEKPHRIDAMLTHLLNAGVLDGVAGFVVGEMTDTDEKGDPEDADWRTIVRERLEPLGVPMVFEYPFGHIDAMLTLPLGRQAKLDADAGTLTYA